ncbi:MAG: HAMP domain-containing histidine kinase [Rikenellaceae bacterium]|nr:HAMP domain-containing histidine kinase [Rikenellaceae bacterium]
MKKNIFRNIAILVVLSLAALTVLQGLWLGRMYSDMNEKFHRQVSAAFERAAYEELITRDLNSSVDRHLMTATFSEDSVISNSMGEIIDSLLSLPAEQRAWSAQVEAEVEEDSTRITITIDKSDLDETQLVLMNLNMSIDMSVKEESLLKCDSLLSGNLVQAGIYAPYSLSLVGIADGITVHSTGEDLSNPVVFELPADSKGIYAYRLAITNPNRGFLREMAGIVASSVLIVLLLAFSFVYLLRTMFRQKSLEKMQLDLTHNITHELKTPIAVASAAGEALSGFGADRDPVKRGEYLGVINDQMARLAAMVENILSMSLYEDTAFSLEYTDEPLSSMVREQVRALALDGREDVKLDISLPEGLTVFCDRKHFPVVLKNLLDNAVKYSPGRATVAVRAAEIGDTTVISVSDNGIGIPQEYRSRIFEKFYRVPTGDRHDVKGFGLGLYHVRETVARHGGTITVDSSPGRGTTFTIRLPRNGR